MIKYLSMVTLLILSCIAPFFVVSYAQNNTYDRAKDPIRNLDSFGNKVNEDRVLDNALNDFDPNRGMYEESFRISNSVDDLRQQIQPYIQWIVYIGLSLAVIGIIYNGLRLVMKPVGIDEGSTKKRLQNIITGVVLLIGFYVVIELILAVIAFILE